MVDIKQREEKMVAKIKESDFRDYLKEISSWCSIVFYKNNNITSICRQSDRI
jgi:hypothetical protein